MSNSIVYYFPKSHSSKQQQQQHQQQQHLYQLLKIKVAIKQTKQTNKQTILQSHSSDKTQSCISFR